MIYAMVSIREQYETFGVEKYYQEHGDTYSNPHREIIHQLLEEQPIGDKVLDLCCGSGEVTSYLQQKNPTLHITGNDPYTYASYMRNTQAPCYRFDFKEIAQGALTNYHFDTIICSFALHLCPISLLPNVLYQLSLISTTLVILTPHKKPELPEIFWYQVEERLVEKVRMRTYRLRDTFVDK